VPGSYVALDSGFVEALESLELTPGPVGSAAIENGSARRASRSPAGT
jgi:UDP-N-acetylenolpyruvoylglucosamine reductase